MDFRHDPPLLLEITKTEHADDTDFFGLTRIIFSGGFEGRKCSWWDGRVGTARSDESCRAVGVEFVVAGQE